MSAFFFIFFYFVLCIIILSHSKHNLTCTVVVSQKCTKNCAVGGFSHKKLWVGGGGGGGQFVPYPFVFSLETFGCNRIIHVLYTYICKLHGRKILPVKHKHNNLKMNEITISHAAFSQSTFSEISSPNSLKCLVTAIQTALGQNSSGGREREQDRTGDYYCNTENARLVRSSQLCCAR